VEIENKLKALGFELPNPPQPGRTRVITAGPFLGLIIVDGSPAMIVFHTAAQGRDVQVFAVVEHVNFNRYMVHQNAGIVRRNELHDVPAGVLHIVPYGTLKWMIFTSTVDCVA